MPEGQEDYVQQPDDSTATGKKIRNLAIDIVQADGSIATTYQQVVGIADENGRPMTLDEPIALLVEIRDYAKIIARCACDATGAAMPPDDD